MKIFMTAIGDLTEQEMFAKTQAAMLINEAIDEIDGGEANAVSGEKFFQDMRKKYDKQTSFEYLPSGTDGL